MQDSFVHAKSSRVSTVGNLKAFRQDKQMRERANQELLDVQYQDHKEDLDVNYFFMSGLLTTAGKKTTKNDRLYNTPDNMEN